MNTLEHMFVSIGVAGGLIGGTGLCWLQNRMIREINQTHQFNPVSLWRRLGWRQQREIGEVYRHLFPDNWKADAYTVFWQLNIGLNILTVGLILTTVFTSQTAQQ